MATVTYKGSDQDFATTAFYDYIKMREGYRLKVYKDTKGNDTVGIGHCTVPADNLKLGDKITPDQVQQFFVYDYNNKLNVEQYVTEVPVNGVPYTLNQMLAIASFIWLHGNGAYANSDYRQHWLNGDYPNESDMQAYLAANWDTQNTDPQYPKLQKRNAADCNIAYKTTDWGASIVDEVVWKLNDTFPSIADYAQDNQALWTFILLLVLFFLFLALIKRFNR